MKKIILSGGGTGGHLYPAVAVGEALKKRLGDDCELLFVGAEGKMEMEKIPALGYKIVGLPVVGLQRKFTFKNFALPFKILKSLRKARRIIKSFDADIVVGFGGYASAPVLWSAQRMKIPTLIQEQNSYAGVTNKILSKKADKICVAYSGMEKFFRRDKIIMTGNPLRGSFSSENISRAEAAKYFSLDENKQILLILGGSLGSRTLNEMMKANLDSIIESADYQVIWQTGKYYEKEMCEFTSTRKTEGLWQGAFIDRMDYAYACASLVISRSGACTVSELCLVGKPTIFVPSPNVAEDHQSKNAKALVDVEAALMIADKDAINSAIPLLNRTLKDNKLLEKLSKNIKSLAINDSSERIVEQILKLI
ncbi:MAG: undecaprenyldiphospho-muramoylpentapeptide beta-N-acetylglucosaminyltransferase [Rikenellaceae bacterium]